MRPLTGQILLQVWEIGQQQHPIDRALTLLAFACPDKSQDELAQLSIGQRDRLLLALRELTFGARIDGIADCPHCGDRLEFAMTAADVQSEAPAAAEFELTLAEFELQFGLPTSRDLAAIAYCPDAETARALLMQRCLRQIKRSGEAIEVEALPPPVLAQLAERVAAADPQAEIWLDFTCPACSHTWQLLFDIVQFFWTELNAEAMRLMREVHTLSRCYGWREADILAMTRLRRQAYLELVG
ncbi:phage baseplate protein [Leptolyngbya ohadii]|uniref:T4 family baseplate hub assembly chaperone n=1 Tax=Leptolyngbya ohadii TaxID=1962290 RepID=UPI000B59DB28|nr:phage baseplate protein [Leptolyngbya ohadii]